MPTETSIPVSAEALTHSQRVSAFLHEQIQQAGGWIPFSQWMHHVLYAPGLGYYAAGSTKLAEPYASGVTPLSGDFVTAPQLTPLFGQTLAKQVAEVLTLSQSTDVLEFGAGSGALAHDIMSALDAGGLAARYFILEVSAELRARQQERLKAWGSRIEWLDALPASFNGCVLANEVLDAMPVELFAWSDTGEVLIRGVTSTIDPGAQTGTQNPAMSDIQFAYAEQSAPTQLAQIVMARMPALPGYCSEVNLQAEAWVRDMGRWLTRGAALLIDYGFPRHEYFHPQRQHGTLMCHIQHRTHDDAFLAPGLQDITAHVDFTAIAQAANAGGLDVLGYTSQARFLLNAGLTELMLSALHSSPSQIDQKQRAHTNAAVQKLISEAEMGELFKVIAIGRGITQPLSGFARSDRSGQLFSNLA